MSRLGALFFTFFCLEGFDGGVGSIDFGEAGLKSFVNDISGGVDGGVRTALAPLEPDSLAKSLAIPLMDTCRIASQHCILEKDCSI